MYALIYAKLLMGFDNVATQAKEIAHHRIVAVPDKDQPVKGNQPTHQVKPSLSIASANK